MSVPFRWNWMAENFPHLNFNVSKLNWIMQSIFLWYCTENIREIKIINTNWTDIRISSIIHGSRTEIFDFLFYFLKTLHRTIHHKSMFPWFWMRLCLQAKSRKIRVPYFLFIQHPFEELQKEMLKAYSTLTYTYLYLYGRLLYNNVLDIFVEFIW